MNAPTSSRSHAITLSEIWIYPVKSLGGIRLPSAQVLERGLALDRRWLVVDQAGKALTQRKFRTMALIDVALAEDGFWLTHRDAPDDRFFVPFEPANFSPVTVRVWDDTVQAVTVDPAADAWLSKYIGKEVRLVKMPESAARPVDPTYAKSGENVSFADAYPLLVISQESLDDLNTRLAEPVTMRRFRPNLVVTGIAPYAEDSWTTLRIGTADFVGTEPCSRCIMTTIDPVTAEPGREPLKTLMSYRKQGVEIMFGMNLLAKAGRISEGDRVELV